MRLYLTIYLAFCCLLASCSSVSDEAVEVKEAVTTEKESANADPAAATSPDNPTTATETKTTIDCNSPPEPVMCCQAMTPACNDCRENSRKLVNEWRMKCASDAGMDCTQKPNYSQCCTTNEPSCEACRKRVDRMLKEFAARCDKK